jgi:thioredoxin 1
MQASREAIMDHDYDKPEPTRADVDTWPGPSVLEFGAAWCPHCQGAQPLFAAALADFSGVRHVKVGDGKGKPLGRSFQVKLWPTLIFLKDGQEAARVVRPENEEEIRDGLSAIAS